MFGEQFSGRATGFSGRVGLDTILLRIHGVLAGHLGDRMAIRTCRVAEAITRDSEVGSGGQRAIEEASGVARVHLKGSGYTKAATGRSYETRPVLPEPYECAYGLLSCTERGLVDWEAEEFEVGVYTVAPDTGGICPSMYPGSSISTSSSGSSSPEKTEMTTTSARGGADPAGITPATAELLADGRKALADPARIGMLDPRKDVWAPWTSEHKDRLGDTGWALAVLLGLRDVELPVGEVYKLLGLPERTARDIVAKLVDSGMAQRIKRGRAAFIEFWWARFILAEGGSQFALDEYWTRQDRAREKAEKAHRTRVRKTPAEKLAWADIWGRRSDESIAAMTDIEREYWLKCGSDRKAEAAHVAMYEKALENTQKMFQAYFAKAAEKAMEKPVEAVRVQTVGDLPPEERQALVDRLGGSTMVAA